MDHWWLPAEIWNHIYSFLSTVDLLRLYGTCGWFRKNIPISCELTSRDRKEHGPLDGRCVLATVDSLKECMPLYYMIPHPMKVVAILWYGIVEPLSSANTLYHAEIVRSRAELALYSKVAMSCSFMDLYRGTIDSIIVDYGRHRRGCVAWNPDFGASFVYSNCYRFYLPIDISKAPYCLLVATDAKKVYYLAATLLSTKILNRVLGLNYDCTVLVLREGYSVYFGIAASDAPHMGPLEEDLRKVFKLVEPIRVERAEELPWKSVV